VIAEASQLLKILEGSKQFEIPIYQRPYAWTEADRQQLWADLLRVGRNAKANAHFVGSVVYIQSGGTFGSSISRARLIDGQQRLTTIMLLLAAMVERLRTDGDLVLKVTDEEGYEHQETISATYLENTYILNSTVTGESRFKLLLTQGDRPTLMHCLGQVPLPPDPSVAVQEAMDFFRRQLQSTTHADVFMGLRKLQVVNVQLEQGKDDPQLIFESLNSTGKDLTQADLIRNYILMGLPGPKQKEVYEHSWFPMEQLFKHAGDDSFDRFVRDYLTRKTRVIPAITKVYAEFKKYRQDDEHASQLTTDALVQDMAEHARLYIKLVEPQRLKGSGEKGQDALMQALTDLDAVEVRVSYPFLLEVLWDHAQGDVSTEELVQLVRFVESFVVRRAVCDIKTNPLNRIFSQLSKDIDKADYVLSVGRALLRQRDQQRFPTDEEFFPQLVDRPLYNSRDLCKSMLVRLERDLSPKELSVTDTLTIEHVLPQNEDLSAPWCTMLGEHWQDAQARLKHTIGNLTLTGYNSELGDLPFEKKKTLESPKGYESSKMLMTREVAKFEKWDSATIRLRGEQLSQQALKLWAMPDLPADELQALKYEGRKKFFDDAWERIQELNTLLLDVFTALDAQLGQLDGMTRKVNKRNLEYRKGNRAFIELSTDDSVLHLWAVLGATPGDIHSAWKQSKNERWWKLSVGSLDELGKFWPDLLAGWARLPDSAPGEKKSASDLQDSLAALEGDAKAAFDAFETELLSLSSTLERNVTQFYIGYGLPVEVKGLVRSGYVQVEVHPPDSDRVPQELFLEWGDRSKERRALNLHSPADAIRAMPLIRAVHQQFVEQVPYRRRNVREFMCELRSAFADLGEDVTVQSSKMAERFVVAGVDIARVYINLDNAYLMLRHQFATLHNPAGIGQVKEDGAVANWPADHFGAYFTDPMEVTQLKLLIRQTYEANRAPVQ
jgi:uncharacterized protein with ParB-like and HNH nuclease domain/predicted transport protein